MSADILRILVVLIGIGLVAVILIQQPKEGGMSAFTGGGGGASSTVFGAKGSGSFLFKLTAALALAFAVTIGALVSVTNIDDTAVIASQVATKVATDNKAVEKSAIPGANKVKETSESAIPSGAKSDTVTDTIKKPTEKAGE